MHTNVGLLQSPFFQLQCHADLFKVHLQALKEYKASAYNAGDPDSIPGLGRSPGEGNGNPLQYSCLENQMNRRTWWATVHEVTESATT